MKTYEKLIRELNESKDTLANLDLFKGLEAQKRFKKFINGFSKNNSLLNKKEIKLTDDSVKITVKDIPKYQFSYKYHDTTKSNDSGKIYYDRVFDAIIEQLGFPYNNKIDIGTKLNGSIKLNKSDSDNQEFKYKEKKYTLVVKEERKGFVSVEFNFDLI
jgi:hypothetical protein